MRARFPYRDCESQSPRIIGRRIHPRVPDRRRVAPSGAAAANGDDPLRAAVSLRGAMRRAALERAVNLAQSVAPARRCHRRAGAALNHKLGRRDELIVEEPRGQLISCQLLRANLSATARCEIALSVATMARTCVSTRQGAVNRRACVLSAHVRCAIEVARTISSGARRPRESGCPSKQTSSYGMCVPFSVCRARRG